MCRHVAVRELAAHDVGVLGEGDVGRGGDLDVVGDAGVVVAEEWLVCVIMRVLREDLHHDGNRALVSHGCEPPDNALLRRHSSIVSWSKTQSPLRTRLLSILELLDRLLDAVGRCASNDGVVLEPLLLQTRLDPAQNLMTIPGVQVDRLARAAEDDKAPDAVLGQVHGVGGLRLNVYRRGDRVVVGGLLGGEKGRDGHVDALGRRSSHDEQEKKKGVSLRDELESKETTAARELHEELVVRG